MIGQDDTGYRVLSIAFGEDGIEITFMEENEQSEDVKEVRSRVVSSKLFRAQVADILDSIAELIDLAAVHRRNPVTSYRRPRSTESDDSGLDSEGPSYE